MSYERFVDTYRRLRKQHKDDPEAIALIDQFGRDAALQRVRDEQNAALAATLAIQKASGRRL